MASRARWALLLALLLALAVACGEDDEPAAAPVDETEEAEEPEEPEETEETEEPDEAEEADSYPEGRTEWIVPFAAGGGADASFRIFQKYAEEIAGVTMTIVNVEGAGGVTGWTQFLNSEPDGYTLSLATPPFNIIPEVLQPDDTPYTLDQFQYMCVFANSPNAIFVQEADDRFDTLEDLLDYARENPGQLTAGTTGAVGTDSFHMYQLQSAAGVEFTLVPFDSGAEVAQALASGSIDVKFSDTSWIELQAGALKALAVSSEERHPSFPDVPTYVENDYEVIGARLRAPAAPPGTPDNVIQFWQDVCEQVTQDTDFQEEMGAIGQPVEFLTAEDATALIDRLEEDIRAVVEEQGLTAEDG
jgi:tripartite-type tricarboxylate transporter receptor subunit TctC